ncbi:hypothetical protein AHiyo8_63640 [Arthrobacter sp. Hiyo8]|nr:hypothetical protein AHiyo8_63640 [Arthrobacter sp. Hiyo8]
MEDIATAASTSKSVYYRYFGDKAGLQQAMGEVVLGQMQRRMKEAAESAQTPREGLFAMVSAYLQMAESSPPSTRSSRGSRKGNHRRKTPSQLREPLATSSNQSAP